LKQKRNIKSNEKKLEKKIHQKRNIMKKTIELAATIDRPDPNCGTKYNQETRSNPASK
jgi:hypothetical protein